MRDIDWDKPLSDEDKEWVEQFGTGAMRRQVEQNERRFGDVESAASEEDSEEDQEQEEYEDNYDEMNLDQLKAEAANRKHENPDLDTTGIKTKAQLIERLREWDRQEQQ
jgi:hypothetical protein